MTAVQFIERDGKHEYAIVPIELFDRLIDAADDRQDIAALETFRREDDGFRVPGQVLHAILQGVTPLKAWREYRLLSQVDLAAGAGISKAYLSQLETGKRKGSVSTFAALATALGVTLDDLLE